MEAGEVGEVVALNNNGGRLGLGAEAVKVQVGEIFDSEFLLFYFSTIGVALFHFFRGRGLED